MIPAGILAQSTRDLSKEIWISWGYDYDQEQGVFVNSFNPTNTNTFLPLKNAKGESTTFNYRLNDFGYDGINTQYHESGVLDIVNRCEIQLEKYIDDVEWFVEQSIEISCSVSTPVSVYVLGPRQASSEFNLGFSGGGGWQPYGFTAIPQSVYPVQTKMEITSDWFEVGERTAFGTAYITTPLNFQLGRIRAIVIKLL